MLETIVSGCLEPTGFGVVPLSAACSGKLRRRRVARHMNPGVPSGVLVFVLDPAVVLRGLGEKRGFCISVLDLDPAFLHNSLAITLSGRLVSRTKLLLLQGHRP